MKSKKLLILILIMSGLLLLVMARKFNEQKAEVSQKNISEEIVLNEGLEASFVEKVIIRQGVDDGLKIEMVKNGAGEWSLPSYYGVSARKSAVDELLGKLTALKGEIRADSKDVISDFLLQETQGVHVILEGPASKKISHLIFSPVRPGPLGNFVRAQDSSQVLVSEEDILSLLAHYSKDAKLEQKTFADMRAANFDSSKIEKFAWQPDLKADSLVSFVRSGADKEIKWLLESGQASEDADNAKISQFLSQINGIYAKEALDPAATSYGFTDKPWISLMGTIEGKPLVIDFFLGRHDADQKIHYLKVSPKGNVFSVYENNLDWFLKKDKSFFLPKPAEPVTNRPEAKK